MSIFSSILHTVGTAAPIVGSIVPGIGTTIGTAVGAGLNAWGSSIDSQDSINQSRAYNQQMWDQTNQYNSPEATAKRLQDAGMNPAFAFQNGAGLGSAQSIPDNTQQLQVNKSNAFNDVAGTIANVAMQNKAVDSTIKTQSSQQRVNAANENLIDSSANLNDAHSTLLRAQAISEGLHQTADKMRNDILGKTGMNSALSLIDNTISSTLKNKAEIPLIKANVKLAAANTLKSVAESNNTNFTTQQMATLLPYTIKKLQADYTSTWLNNQFTSDALRFSRGVTTNDFPSNFGNRARMFGFAAQQLQNDALRKGNEHMGLMNTYQGKDNDWYEFNSIMRNLNTVGAWMK